jgi:CBS domain-containing protein
MQVIDVMTTTVYTATEHMPVMSAFRILAAHHVSSLPVIDERGGVVGIVSEQDVLRGCVEPPGFRSSELSGTTKPQRVADVMTFSPHTVSPSADVADVVRIFSMMGWKSLPVVRHGQLVGMVSRSDVVQALGRADADVLRDVELALAGAGLGHWRASVSSGKAVLIADGQPGDADRAVAVTRAVVGVRAVRCLTTMTKLAPQ